MEILIWLLTGLFCGGVIWYLEPYTQDPCNWTEVRHLVGVLLGFTAIGFFSFLWLVAVVIDAGITQTAKRLKTNNLWNRKIRK